jgi:hypothetical protein
LKIGKLKTVEDIEEEAGASGSGAVDCVGLTAR